jgi:anti-anti-sigma factor
MTGERVVATMTVVSGVDRHEAQEAAEDQVVVHAFSGGSLIRITGDLDLSTAARLRATFETALASDPWIIVDLSRAGVTDSVGLGVLVAARHGARRRGGDVLLAAAPPFLVSFLQAARLSGVFTMFDTVPQAMTATLSRGTGPR